MVILLKTCYKCLVVGGDRLNRDVHMMLGRKLPVFVRVSCAFVTPVVLGV